MAVSCPRGGVCRSAFGLGMLYTEAAASGVIGHVAYVASRPRTARESAWGCPEACRYWGGTQASWRSPGQCSEYFSGQTKRTVMEPSLKCHGHCSQMAPKGAPPRRSGILAQPPWYTPPLAMSSPLPFPQGGKGTVTLTLSNSHKNSGFSGVVGCLQLSMAKPAPSLGCDVV